MSKNPLSMMVHLEEKEINIDSQQMSHWLGADRKIE